MLINHSFQVDQPIDQVWNFFDDVPLSDDFGVVPTM